jgi:D-alanyl-D-alanine dipeptidase
MIHFRFILFAMSLVLGGLMSTSYAILPNVTLIADPQVLKIPIHDNHEPLVDLTKQTDIAYGPSPEIPNNKDYTFLRKTVYEQLKKASTHLPHGVHFCLYEGYRSLSLQEMLFNEHYAHIRAHHPDWSQEELFNETTKLVSPVVNQDQSKNIPPHSTGGAIDVYLIDDQGQPLDMGIHPKDWMQDKDGTLSFTDSKVISQAAKTNRALMSQVLEQVGFVNYPTEYWHWSYGDRYWAFVKKEPFALYGVSEPNSPNRNR